MYVRFDLACEGRTQRKLHKIFRDRIREWKRLGLVSRAVLTYHYYTPPRPSDSLYVCLDIPTTKNLDNIPSSIMQNVNEACRDNNVRLSATDYSSDIEREKRRNEQEGSTYYDNAPVEEILRFASFGTEIACGVLEHLKDTEDFFEDDAELSRYIFSSLRRELGADYRWIHWALHFVCNPLLIPEYSILSPLGRRAITGIRSYLAQFSD